jgi:hypothetical protein
MRREAPSLQALSSKGDMTSAKFCMFSLIGLAGGQQNQEQEEDVEDFDLVQRDIRLNVHDVDSELRRVSDFGVYGMEAGDLATVEKVGAYVKSSCIDLWSVVANKHLSKLKRRDVFILTMPASQAIFYDFISGSDDLYTLARTWASWKTAFLKHVLIPVNLHNKHWCLLVVDFEKKKVFCWDSLVKFDSGEFVADKKRNLFEFLKTFTGDEQGHWELEVLFDDVPQQKTSDCGIFCIEFMRAFINGSKSAPDLKGRVEQASMRAARQHILRELKEKEIVEKDAYLARDKRERKKSKKNQ